MSPKRRRAAQAGGSKKRPRRSETFELEAGSSSSEWCMDCGAASAAACRGAHRCVDALTARAEAEGRLRAAQATLRRLDALAKKEGIKLTAVANLLGDEGERDEGAIGITLTVSSLGSGERQAVLDLLEGLCVEPDEKFLSGSGGNHVALRSLRARLPTHGAGTTLKAGAILIGGDVAAASAGLEDEDDEDENEGESEGSRDSRLGDGEVRIYYNKAVKPTQAPGARILGYVSRNLKLMGRARPQGSYHLPGWGQREDTGMNITLGDVQFA